VLVLDMGEPVRIAGLVEQLISSSTRPIEVVFTGLRPGEKLHERLHSADERPVRTAHPLITSVAVPPLAPDDRNATINRVGTDSV
jgi:FlaA1/EpsC-like NDP-sugar epimerase